LTEFLNFSSLQLLISQARQLYANDDFGLQLQETVYVLDATIIDLSLYTILQILSITLFEKMPIFQALTTDAYKNEIPSNHIQLKLFDS
jgi:hypothetical protein